MRARGVAGSTSRMGSVSTADYAISRWPCVALAACCFVSSAGAGWRSPSARRSRRRRRGSSSVPADAWWVDGLSLIVGATGLALFWTGLTGASPDWVDDDDWS